VSIYVFFGVRLMANNQQQRMKDLNDIKITDITGKPLSKKALTNPNTVLMESILGD